MKTRLCALLLGLMMIAGCGMASQTDETSSPPEETYTPTYSYVNPDPDMVLITSPGGDITYKDYRLYLDVNEQISRMAARQQMAVCAALERDFKEMGIEIDEEDYQSVAAQDILNLMLYTPSMSEEIATISDATGMTEDEISKAMLLTSRSNYLINLLGEHFTKTAEKELDAESSASSQSSSVTDSGAEEARQQAVYAKVTQMMEDYSADYDTRLSLDDESVLVNIDGEAVPYTDEAKHYIEYMAIGARIDAAAFIQAGEMVFRELERRETEFDRTQFDATLSQYIASVRADEAFMTQLNKFCSIYGATTDDYFKALERPLWLQQVGDLYYIALTDEFNAMPQDAADKPASADDHYVAEFAKLMEGSEVVNITGK